MGDYEAKGQDFLAKAEKKLKGMSFFGNKYEEAAELLEKAANNFKLAKNWQLAGETYRKLSDIQLRLDSKHDAATASVEAAKAFLKVDHKCAYVQHVAEHLPHCAAGHGAQTCFATLCRSRLTSAGLRAANSRCDFLCVAAIASLQQAVQLYTDMGRLTMAARQLREIAELQEKQDNKEVAMEFYNQAADLFSGEESTADANKCKLKIAQFSAELEKYQESITVYEDIARGCVDNNLLKYSAKGYLLNAGICRLCCQDVWEVRTAIDKYNDIDPNFQGTREEKLLRDVCDAVEEGDTDKFQDAIAQYDSLTRLDAWKTTLLLRVKKRIPEGEEVSLA